YLPGLQEANQPLPQSDGHNGLAQAGWADSGGGFQGCRAREFLLHRQTRAAGAAPLRHDWAKGAFVSLAVEWELPGLHRSWRNRQPGGFRESPLVVREN